MRALPFLFLLVGLSMEINNTQKQSSQEPVATNQDAATAKKILERVLKDVDRLSSNVRSEVDRLRNDVRRAIYELDSLSVSEIPQEQSGTPAESSETAVKPTAELAPQISPAADEMVEIVTFGSDQAVLPGMMPEEKVLPEKATQQQTDFNSHSVISFLRRPVIISSVEWLAGTTRDTNLFNVIIPDIALNLPIYRGKLDGYTSFRATAVLRLQVNAQPFQCGRLILAAVPMPTLIRGRGQYLEKHPALLQGVNHVQMDINKQTEVILRVPFLSPFNAYDLIHGEYPWARIIVRVYSPLNSVDQSSLQCILWVSFDDIVMGAPTSAPVISIAQEQSGQPSASAVGKQRGAEGSSTSSKIAGVVSGVGSLIPGLGGIATAASSVISGVGSLFGFSKPLNTVDALTILSRPTHNFANEDGADNALGLGLKRDNNIDSYPGLGGTSMKETSLHYVRSIPQWIGQFAYTVNTRFRDELFRIHVMPHAYLPGSATFISPVGAPRAIGCSQPTILGYISNMFVYWTGSLVYTFRFVKTDFHSGRVEISFHPFAPEVDKDRVDYTYRTVVDLRTTSEISVSVPYISPTPWKLTTQYDPYDNMDWSLLGPHSTGTIYIRAITPLIVGNSIASSCIECLVEQRAGPDFQLQTPTNSVYWPLSLREVAQEQSGPVAVPGTIETRTTAIEGFVPPSITGEDADISREDTQMLCAGEIFSDFQQLTRRFSFTTKWAVPKFQVLEVRVPYYIKPPELSHQSAGVKSITPGCDTLSGAGQYQFEFCPSILSAIGGMYAFYRGGMRVKATIDSSINNQRGIQPILSGRLVPSQDYSYPSLVSRKHGFMSPVGLESLQQKRLGEFQVPFYSPVLLNCHWAARENNLFIQSRIALQLCLSDAEQLPDVNEYVINIAIAAADDFEFNTFLGAPFVVKSESLDSTYFDGDCGYRNWDLSRFNVDPFYPDLPNDIPQVGSEIALTLGDLTYQIPQSSCQVPNP